MESGTTTGGRSNTHAAHVRRYLGSRRLRHCDFALEGTAATAVVANGSGTGGPAVMR